MADFEELRRLNEGTGFAMPGTASGNYGKCPYCRDYRASDVWGEIEHMLAHHPLIVADRMRAIGEWEKAEKLERRHLVQTEQLMTVERLIGEWMWCRQLANLGELDIDASQLAGGMELVRDRWKDKMTITDLAVEIVRALREPDGKAS